MLPRLLKHQFKISAKQLQFSEDAGGDPQGDSAIGGILEFALKVDISLHHDLDEVAIEEQLVGIVEVVVDTEEIYDSADLLIVHRII